MPDLPQDPWSVSESDFPTTGDASEKLRFLLNYAILAPSGHNAQPWLFDINGDWMELCSDDTRTLFVVDPENRELTISCGAALFHLRIALRHFGYSCKVETLPEPEHSHLLARVRLGSEQAPTAEEELLFHAILKRRTNRRLYEARQVPDSLIAALEAAVAEEGAWAHIVPPDARGPVAELVAQGDRTQWADKLWRRELAEWVRPNHGSHKDGIPGYALGFGDALSVIGPFFIRAFNLGKAQSSEDRRLVEVSPVVVALGTDGDTASDWLSAGQALARILLRACAEGIYASYLNQPIEVPSLRPRLRDALGRSGFPQLLLRMGYGPEIRPTPRRPTREVLL